jgi:hypothetical protein
MYAACANVLSIHEKIIIYELIDQIEQISPLNIDINNLLKNIITSKTSNNSRTIANKLTEFINTITTNAEYKTIALDYCTKYMDYINFIEQQYDNEFKAKISLRYINEKLGNPMQQPKFNNDFTFNEFNMKYMNETFYYKYWTKRIDDEKELIFNTQQIKVQDVRALDIRRKAIKLAIESMQLQYDKIYSKTITQDEFIVIIPDIYKNYNEYNSDIANHNDFL